MSSVWWSNSTEAYDESTAGSTPVQGHLWPGYEEFAVLYSSHYRGREFPYRTSLPEEQNLNRYQLRWNPSVWVDCDTDQLCVAHSRHGNVGMTAESLALMNRGVQLPTGDLVDLLCGGGDERRNNTRRHHRHPE